MGKLLLILATITLSLSSYGKINNKQQAEFSSICYKASKKRKNYPQYCGCVKNNLRWLVSEESWEDAKAIFSSRIGSKDYGENDGRVELDNMIMNIELSCFEDTNYLAPKAKSEIQKYKKKVSH